MASSFDGVTIDAGRHAPDLRQRLRQAWLALLGPPPFKAAVWIDGGTVNGEDTGAPPGPTIVTVADGGRIDIAGSIVLGSGASISARPGGGFVIVMPSERGG